ncbi:MAG: ABC transporter substrate-binding protein [Dehalococcoidia bacterium]|nr:MAG: ABC transporter substrate-binding protein [Dehalococcoidia bacterium]
MKRLIPLLLVFVLVLLACGPAAPAPGSGSLPSGERVTEPGTNLHPNPVETGMPQYGGTLTYGYAIPRSLDAHQKVGYGPTGTLPTFNQLVIFDIAYKDTVPETIIGDLADRWETSPDGTEITFHLHPGVKWHDGMPFTADDVVYSLDKMADPNRSAIADFFPAYRDAERLDDTTVKVHMKYASAGFLISLAAGESVIQAKHLAGTSDQSADFMIGTGPFILEEYLTRVHMKWKRNPDYFKKDKYGNQLPYLDGLKLLNISNAELNDALLGRRVDLKGPVTGAGTVSTYEYLKNGAPELLWQKRDDYVSEAIFFNLNHKPLDDLRVRRAMGLILDEESLIIGYCGDATFGVTDIGLLQRSYGLPAEEIRTLMGWDKTMEERVAEAQQLMAEAGYPNGFKLNMLSRGGAQTAQGATLVFAEALRKHLKIDAEVNGLASTEVAKRLDENNYDMYTVSLKVGLDPAQLAIFFASNSYANYAHYANPDMDTMLTELDRIIDPSERREAIWAIERTLLTDLPALPTGTFIANFLPYYPYIKNLRFTDMPYSNINRFEDVWIDRDIYQQVHGKPLSAATAPAMTPPPMTTPETAPVTTPEPPVTTPEQAPVTTPEPSSAPSQTAANSYDDPDWPVIWVKIDPAEGVSGGGTMITVTLKVPPGSFNEIIFINPVTGTRSSRRPAPAVADADGNVVLGPWEVHSAAAAGEATIELTCTKTDGTKIVVTHPYTLK